MTLVPTLNCRNMAEAVGFYTGVLDFTHHGSFPGIEDPSYGILTREGHELHLSSYPDGVFGQAVGVIVEDVDAVFASFMARGLPPSLKADSPVHQAPLDQTWGTREVYVDDPSGNTLRFIQR